MILEVLPPDFNTPGLRVKDVWASKGCKRSSRNKSYLVADYWRVNAVWFHECTWDPTTCPVPGGLLYEPWKTGVMYDVDRTGEGTIILNQRVAPGPPPIESSADDEEDDDLSLIHI